ncbi:unnamed protein product [Microthlaspi erraticum]|uniref:Uncharacterized protein n=1 Tax=Microthlaspi erraticum TaxID=1685480 RepID=A0A6D2HZZ1_9BRAS|nr:unnamed protein product [Microthlaspi erraticum]
MSPETTEVRVEIGAVGRGCHRDYISPIHAVVCWCASLRWTERTELIDFASSPMDGETGGGNFRGEIRGNQAIRRRRSNE